MTTRERFLPVLTVLLALVVGWAVLVSADRHLAREQARAAVILAERSTARAQLAVLVAAEDRRVSDSLRAVIAPLEASRQAAQRRAAQADSALSEARLAAVAAAQDSAATVPELRGHIFALDARITQDSVAHAAKEQSWLEEALGYQRALRADTVALASAWRAVDSLGTALTRWRDAHAAEAKAGRCTLLFGRVECPSRLVSLGIGLGAGFVGREVVAAVLRRP